MHSCGSALFLLLHLLRATNAEVPYTTLECGLPQGIRPLASTARGKRVAGGVLVFARNSNRHCHLPPTHCSAEVRVHPLGTQLVGCSIETQKKGSLSAREQSAYLATAFLSTPLELNLIFPY